MFVPIMCFMRLFVRNGWLHDCGKERAGIHVDRTSGGHRNYCDPDRIAASSGAAGPGGGAEAAFADGSVRFISENIHAGNPSAPEALIGQSPYGIWGGLATIGQSEVLGEF